MQLITRVMTAADLDAVVRVHQLAFRGFFLDRMGPAFLRAYYSSVLSYDKSIALVAEGASGVVEGFVVGFIEPVEFYLHFRGQRLRLLPVILLALIKHPSLLMNILRNSARVHQVAEHYGSIECELSSIASSQQIKGTGSLLLHKFVDEVKMRGVERISLTTDELNNDSVNYFYLRHGFRATGRELRADRTLIVYSLNLADSLSSSLDCEDKKLSTGI